MDWVLPVTIIWDVRLGEGGEVDDTSDVKRDSRDDDEANCSGNEERDNMLSSESIASRKGSKSVNYVGIIKSKVGVVVVDSVSIDDNVVAFDVEFDVEVV